MPSTTLDADARSPHPCLPQGVSLHVISSAKSLHCPLMWWRTRQPQSFTEKDLSPLRCSLIGTTALSDPEWPEAIAGGPVATLSIGLRMLRRHGIGAREIDLAISAALACAIEGDATSPILISSALRRRSKLEPACLRLSERWLSTRF